MERKHIKVTDLWPENTPNRIPHNYRHQRIACRESPTHFWWRFCHLYTLKYVYVAIKLWYSASWQHWLQLVTIPSPSFYLRQLVITSSVCEKYNYTGLSLEISE